MTTNRIDKYKAIWLSHSSISDFKKCPRLYYLHNIYKNNNGRKINIVSPYMSLGIAVHNIIENLKTYKVEERKKLIENFIHDYNASWENYSGIKGGFSSPEQEAEFKLRGENMLKNVMEDPKILLNKTVSTKSYYDGDLLPNFYISEEENLILCGNIDWIEYLDDSRSLRVIDFKTGKNEESSESMQLYIYKLLIERLGSKWPVTGGAYWYLENNKIQEVNINDKDKIDNVINDIIEVGIKIRDLKYEWSENAKWGRPGWVELPNYEDNFKCSGSKYCECQKYDKIISGNEDAIYVGVDMYGKDSYYILI